MNKRVRTRYAPSPTGYMHIGNLRTALYEYLIAKKNKGDFVLRIEDTDQERYVPGAVEVIYKTLKMAGLKHDEGPDIGGDYGPYVQSERKNIYLEYAKKLVDKGEAYYCFCTKERLSKLKESQSQYGEEGFKYDRHCLHLKKEEIEKNLLEGVPYVIRQKMPTEGVTGFDDFVYGHIDIENKELDDQILIKSDGLPTYNFANVIDDHLMKITHIVRGNEYLTSTPKYNLLYKAFGWELPSYVHVPLILKNSGQKLSKRAGDPSFEDLVEQGYLVEAIVNYVVLLGWSPKGNQEIFSLAELEDVFDISGISKSPAIFDINKLNWMNTEYIRMMDKDKFHELALPYYKNLDKSVLDIRRISELIQGRVERLTDIPDKLTCFLLLPEYDNEIYVHKKMKTTLEMSRDNLKVALKILDKVDNWTEDAIHNALFSAIQDMGIKNGQMLWPVRTAVTGLPASPGGAIEIAYILGKTETLRRIRVGIEKLGGLN
ncbi:MAG: glutamate--tRNA ligase [Clostridiales bacterium]|nr:glutamate--tRNA ligase [Clostridiales bacterium]